MNGLLKSLARETPSWEQIVGRRVLTYMWDITIISRLEVSNNNYYIHWNNDMNRWTSCGIDRFGIKINLPGIFRDDFLMHDMYREYCRKSGFNTNLNWQYFFWY